MVAAIADVSTPMEIMAEVRERQRWPLHLFVEGGPWPRPRSIEQAEEWQQERFGMSAWLQLAGEE